MFELFRMMGTIGVDNSDANSSLSETEGQAERTSSNIAKSMMDGLGQVEQAIGSVGSFMTKWVTGPMMAVGAGIFGLMTKTGNYADEILDLSAITGLSTDALQEWEYVADIAGVSGDAVAQSARRMTQRLDGLTEETEANAQMFDEMGLSHQAWIDMDQEDKMNSVIYALADMEDETRRNEIANEMFGRGWTDLAPILDMSAEELEALGIEAHELGVVLSEDSLNAANDFRIEMEKLKNEFMAVFYEVALQFIPIFQEVFLPLIRDHIVPAVLDFGERIAELAEWFRGLDEDMQHNILQWAGIAAAIGPALVIFSKVLGVVKGIVGIFAAKIGIMTAVVVGIGALVAGIVWLYQTNETARNIIDAVWSFIRDFVTAVVEAVVGFVMNLWGSLTDFWAENNEAILAIAERIWGYIEQTISNVMGIIVPFIEYSWGIITLTIETAMDLVLSVIEVVLGLIQGDWEQVWSGIVNFLSTIIESIKSAVELGFTFIYDTIRNTITNALDTVEMIFGNIRDSIENSINSARDAVSAGVDAILGFMDFDWEIPMPRLPRFSLDGSLNPLNWPPIPSIGVEWYAQGGIMEKATAFGMNGNNMMVGGEAGREAVLPLNQKNLSGIGQGIAEASGFNVREIVAYLRAILDKLESGDNQVIEVPVVIDGRVVAKAIKDPMDNELGKKQHDKNQSKGRK